MKSSKTVDFLVDCPMWTLGIIVSVLIISVGLPTYYVVTHKHDECGVVHDAEYFRAKRDNECRLETKQRYNELYMAEELKAIRVELQTLNSNLINLK